MRLPSALAALLFTVGCTDFACGTIGDPPFDEPPFCAGRDGLDGCASDRECVGGFCDRGPDQFCGVCVTFLCLETADCAADETCDAVRGQCERTDACEVLAPERGCTDGASCAPVDATAQCTVPVVGSCELVPATVLVTDGRAALVEVLALDDVGRPLPVDGEVTLPASAAGVARCAGPERCRDVVSASAGDATCTAPSLVLPTVTPGTVRVVVRDVDTGALLANASVRIETPEAIVDETTDDDGVVEVPGTAIASVRADAVGYESVAVIGAVGVDIEVPMPRVATFGTRAGVRYAPDYDGMPAVGDIAVGIGSLSTPDLVHALDADSLAGPVVEATFEIEGVTNPGGDVTTQPSATTMTLGARDILATGVALGRPGARLLSLIGARVRLADISGAIAATREPDARVYDLMLGLWDQGVRGTSFDLVGTVALAEGPLPATDDDFAAFGDGESAVPHPVLDASDEIDVVVPPLLEGHDAAFVALYAHVPGRGFVLLALRFVNDDDGDGSVDDPLSADSLGIVRLFVAPSSWTSGRELIAVAGSQPRDEQRDGRLATDRVSGRVAGASTVLPAFRTDGSAVVDGLTVTLAPSADLRVIHGDGYRVYLANDATAVDVGALGFTADIDAVWVMQGASSFAPGTLDVARALAAPRSSRATFVRAPL